TFRTSATARILALRPGIFEKTAHLCAAHMICALEAVSIQLTEAKRNVTKNNRSHPRLAAVVVRTAGGGHRARRLSDGGRCDTRVGEVRCHGPLPRPTPCAEGGGRQCELTFPATRSSAKRRLLPGLNDAELNMEKSCPR